MLIGFLFPQGDRFVWGRRHHAAPFVFNVRQSSKVPERTGEASRQIYAAFSAL